MSNNDFQDTGSLVRFILRRDRLRIPIWLLSIIGVTLVIAMSFPALYGSEQEREAIAGTMLNPAMTAMIGPGYGLADYHTGAMMSHQMLLFTALTVGIMGILLVARHTRRDEEGGRIEIIRSLPVGRLSNLASTVVVMTATFLLLALTTGLTLYALGIESMGLEGSLLYGAVLGVTGLVFAAITTVFAQLTVTSRGTIGYSFAALGGFYFLRAIGDISSEPLSLIAPLGLILRSEVYVNNYWWPILVLTAISVILFAVAFRLNAVRDLEAGFIAARSGRTTASDQLGSSLGLAWRLQKTTIIGWAIGVILLGVSYGSVMGDMEAFLESSEVLKDMLPTIDGASIAEQFITMIMLVMAIVCAIPGLMIVLKLKAEEQHNRTEHLLARSVSRVRLLSSYLFLGVVSGVGMLFLSTLGLWATASAVMDEPLRFASTMKSGMVYAPAILFMIGLAVLLLGLFKKGTGLIWLYLTFTFFVTYLGGLLQIPTWVMKLTPYDYIPVVPLDGTQPGILIAMTGLSVALAAFGFLGYRRRDVLGS